jgi:hypothetical protein
MQDLLDQEVAFVQSTFNSGRTSHCAIAHRCFALGDTATAVLEL